MSSTGPSNGGQQEEPQPAALNNARRPQRLYLKTQNAMKIVDKILQNRQLTGIKEFLGQAEYTAFRSAVRTIIRTEFDANMDSWPIREVHNYVPDARGAILHAMEEGWELFAVADGDEFVPSELIYEKFYTGPWV
ncbi:hypothetical protein E8E14_008154 [Neopestalotiopsis sp. 37M]|nr:hypothetical protein E8E14_008154 [Neopestalotiopsis sp. 37M]